MKHRYMYSSKCVKSFLRRLHDVAIYSSSIAIVTIDIHFNGTIHVCACMVKYSG